MPHKAFCLLSTDLYVAFWSNTASIQLQSARICLEPLEPIYAVVAILRYIRPYSSMKDYAIERLISICVRWVSCVKLRGLASSSAFVHVWVHIPGCPSACHDIVGPNLGVKPIP